MKRLKKIAKRSAAVLMMLVLLLSSQGMTNVLAANPTNTKVLGIYRISVGGTTVYCLNEGHHSWIQMDYTQLPVGKYGYDDFSLSSNQEKALQKVMEYGCNPNASFTKTKYVATQLLVWDIVNNNGFATNIASGKYTGVTGARFNSWNSGNYHYSGATVSKDNKQKVKNLYLSILKNACQDEMLPSYMYKTKDASDNHKHQMKYSQSKGRYSYTFKNDSNGMISKMHLDTSYNVEKLNKYDIKTSVSGKNLTVTAKADNITEDTKITLRFKKDVSSRVRSVDYITAYGVKNYKDWEGGKYLGKKVECQNLGLGHSGTDNVYAYVQVNLKPSFGKCSVKKVDEQGNPLVNAGFTLYLRDKTTKEYVKYGEEKFTKSDGTVAWDNIDLKGENSVQAKMVETTPPYYVNDVGRILRTFKIKKNVEVTDNGKDNF